MKLMFKIKAESAETTEVRQLSLERETEVSLHLPLSVDYHFTLFSPPHMLPDLLPISSNRVLFQISNSFLFFEETQVNRGFF